MLAHNYIKQLVLINLLASLTPSKYLDFRFSSVQVNCSVTSDALRLHELQRSRIPWPSPTPGVYSNSCPLSRWCHPVIPSPVVPFSSHLQSFPASGSFQMHQFFPSIRWPKYWNFSFSISPSRRRQWHPTPVLLPRKSHGQRSLVGCSPWGR